MEDKLWYLKQINILKCLSEQELMSLESQCSMVRYKEGDLVYLPGTDPNIYFIKSGSVKLVSLSEGGGGYIKDVIEEGEIFGKFLGSEAAPNEQVVAVEDCLVCYLPFTRWQDLIKNNSSLSISFTKWIGLRIKRLERKMDSLYFKDSRQRITEAIQDIAQRFGKPDKSGNTVVNLRLTHDELAQLTGTSRQSVNSFLNELRGKGLIDYKRNVLIIKPAFTNVIAKPLA